MSYLQPSRRGVDATCRIPAHLAPDCLTTSEFQRTARISINSEIGHGKTVSVENPYRQPYVASGNADADLWLRFAALGRRHQAAGFSDLDLRLQDGRRWAGLLRFRRRPARAAVRDGRGPRLSALQ